MKYLTLKNIGSSLVLIASMGACSVANAHGDEKHDATPASKADAVPEAKAEQQQIPTTVEGIWQAIDHNIGDLDKVIHSGTLDKVHHHAFAIRDLVAALPERSQSLPADKLTKVKSSVKFVATLAERLDATGDAKDKAGTQANFEKLTKVLATLRVDTAPTRSK